MPNPSYEKKPFRRTKMGDWHRENSGKMRFERGNPQHYESPDSEDYRRNYEAIDWKDDGKGKP